MPKKRGCRRGNVARLNAVTKVYRPIVQAAGKAYDGHNGPHAHVYFGGWTKVDEPMFHSADHEQDVNNTLAGPLPQYRGVDGAKD